MSVIFRQPAFDENMPGAVSRWLRGEETPSDDDDEWEDQWAATLEKSMTAQ